MRFFQLRNGAEEVVEVPAASFRELLAAQFGSGAEAVEGLLRDRKVFSVEVEGVGHLALSPRHLDPALGGEGGRLPVRKVF